MVYEEYYHKIINTNYLISEPDNPALDSPQNKEYQNKVIEALSILNRANILTRSIAEKIYAEPYKTHVYRLIRLLNQLGLLDKSAISKYLNTYLAHASEMKFIINLFHIFRSNKWEGLISVATFETLFLHNQLYYLHALISKNSSSKASYRLTEADVAILIQNPNPFLITSEIAAYLNCSETEPSHESPLINFIIRHHLTPDFDLASLQYFLSVITNHEQAWSIYEACRHLIKMDCLKAHNIYALMDHPNPQQLVMALDFLCEAKLLPYLVSQDKASAAQLAQELFNQLIHHPCPHKITRVLVLMSDFNLLKKSYGYHNVNRVMTHSNIYDLIQVMDALCETILFQGNRAQANFERLVEHQDICGVNLVLKALPSFNSLSDQAQQNYFNAITANNPKKAAAKILTSYYPCVVMRDKEGFISFLDDDGLISISSNSLWLLSRTGLLSRDNVISMSQSVDTPVFLELIEILYNLNLFHIDAAPDTPSKVAQANFDALLSLHKRVPEDELVTRLIYLKNTLLLAVEVFPELDTIAAQYLLDEILNLDITYPILMGFHTWLTYFECEQFLSGSAVDCQLIAKHKKPLELAEALVELYQAGLLTGYAAQQNRLVVSAHKDPLAMAKALKILQQNNLLASDCILENRWTVGCHQNPEEAAHTLVFLTEKNILTATNFSLFKASLATLEQPYVVCQQALARARCIFEYVSYNSADKLEMRCHPAFINSALHAAYNIDSALRERFVLMQLLYEYIVRIEASDIDKPQELNFNKGFHFFSQSRAANREANYYLAKKLIYELAFYPELSIGTIFKELENKRERLIDFRTSVPGFRKINSNELNLIICKATEYAQKELSVDESVTDKNLRC